MQTSKCNYQRELAREGERKKFQTMSRNSSVFSGITGKMLKEIVIPEGLIGNLVFQEIRNILCVVE